MKHDGLPRLIARLETDPDGRPEFLEGGLKRHYKVVLEVENAPQDTYAATFELSPSNYDPMRTRSPDEDGQVRLLTTTDGDFDLRVRLRTKTGEIRITDRVSRALERWRQRAESKPDPAIDEAIRYIAMH